MPVVVARSPSVSPRRSAMPCSVTTMSTSLRGVDTTSTSRDDRRRAVGGRRPHRDHRQPADRSRRAGAEIGVAADAGDHPVADALDVDRAVEADLDRRIARHETGRGGDGAAVVGLAHRRQSQHAGRRETLDRLAAPRVGRDRRLEQQPAVVQCRPSHRSADPIGCAPGSVASWRCPRRSRPARTAAWRRRAPATRRARRSAGRCRRRHAAAPARGSDARSRHDGHDVAGRPSARRGRVRLRRPRARHAGGRRQLRSPADRAGEGVAVAAAHGGDHADVGWPLGEQ